MRLSEAAGTWRTDGFVILPGHIPVTELAPAVAQLELCFPSPAGFHDGSDPRRTRFIGDEFDGIDSFRSPAPS